MAERVTDLRDIERRVVAHLVGEPAPGVPTPTEPSVLVAEDLAPERHLRPRPRAGHRPRDRARRRDQPHGDHRPPARHPVRGRRRRRHGDPGRDLRRRRRRGRHHRAGRRPRGGRARGSRRAVALREELAALDRPRRDVRRDAGQAARQRRRRRLRRVRRSRARRGRRACSAPSCASSTARRSRPSRSRPTSTARSSRPTPTAATSSYAPSTPAPTSRSRSRPTRARRTPPSASAGCGCRFDNPGLMDRQLDGIAAAAERTGTETWVMAPMVATVAEAADFAAQVRARGLKAGVMVEIPSAALLAHRMLEVVDFLSIGTNDLTQYAMAADRMATDLAHLTDPWQPAVLQLIAITAEAGTQAGKPVGVCGEAAADPLLATALIGMGITSLSMAARAVRPVGAQLGKVTLRDVRGGRRGRPRRPRPDGRAGCRTRAARALSADARLVRRDSLGSSASARGSGDVPEAPTTSTRRKHDISVRPLPRGRSRPAGRSLGLEPVRRGRGQHGQGWCTRAARPSRNPMPTTCWCASTAWGSASPT